VKANVLFFDKKRAVQAPATKNLWIYDLRTKKRFTLRKRQIGDSDLEDFVSCYRAADRRKRKESERFRRYGYDDLAKRDKMSMDIFWLKSDALEDLDNLPKPDVIAAEIMSDLETAMAEFKGALDELRR
jgi:type I restriction enzyme M protein